MAGVYPSNGTSKHWDTPRMLRFLKKDHLVDAWDLMDTHTFGWFLLGTSVKVDQLLVSQG